MDGQVGRCVGRLLNANMAQNAHIYGICVKCISMFYKNCYSNPFFSSSLYKCSLT